VTNLLTYFARFTACPETDEVMSDLMRFAPWKK
jgi:hypothetical protein